MINILEVGKAASLEKELKDAFITQAQSAIKGLWVETAYKSMRNSKPVFRLVSKRTEKSNTSEFTRAQNIFTKQSKLSPADENWISKISAHPDVSKNSIRTLPYLRGDDMKIAGLLTDLGHEKASKLLTSLGYPEGKKSIVLELIRKQAKYALISDSLHKGNEKDLDGLKKSSKDADLFIALTLAEGLSRYQTRFDTDFALYKTLSGDQKLEVRRDFKNIETLKAKVSTGFSLRVKPIFSINSKLKRNLAIAMGNAGKKGVKASADDVRARFGMSPVQKVKLGVKYRTKINNRVATLVRRLDTTTKQIMSNVLVKGITEGKTQTEIIKELNKLIPNISKARATMIVTTETTAIFSHMREDSAKLNGMLEKEWIDAGDERVCPFCFSNTAQGRVPITESFPSGHLKPPTHPRCRCYVEYYSKPSKISKAVQPSRILDDGFSRQEVYSINPYRIFDGSGFIGIDSNVSKYISKIGTKTKELTDLTYTGKDKTMLIDHKAERIKPVYLSEGRKIFRDMKTFREFTQEPATTLELILLQARLDLTDYGFGQILSKFNINDEFKAMKPQYLRDFTEKESSKKPKKGFNEVLSKLTADEVASRLKELGFKTIPQGYSPVTLLGIALVRPEFIPEKYRL